MPPKQSCLGGAWYVRSGYVVPRKFMFRKFPRGTKTNHVVAMDYM